jgi:1-deoxy-D-xylulose-5-phosphate synthase
MPSVLSSILKSDDLKKIPEESLCQLADEVRELIIEVVSKNGGHLASNLGAVELTIALHRVFNSPSDALIWDVGHQCYTHKILTGRKDLFRSIRTENGLSGFPKRDESTHDLIETGHASTAISSALGILEGKKIQNIPGKVVAVVGDGALGGGLALEGLNHAGHLKKDLVVVLNDNEMSINRNVGAISSYLSRLTTTEMYQTFRDRFDSLVNTIPKVGPELLGMIERFKRAVKAVAFKENLFSDLGFEYVGPIDGHNIKSLINVFKNIKQVARPVVVHVRTIKGHGYSYAENDPTSFHGISSFSVIDGKVDNPEKKTFTQAFSQSMIDFADKDDKIVAITAAMAKGTGLSPFKARFPDRFYDVGITEQHAVTFAAGLAAAGLKPVAAIYSTFLQRAVDQVIHDVALPGHSVIFALDRAGLVGNDGATHQGIFDIALFRGIPGITMLSPASTDEVRMMLEYSLNMRGPVMIRYPKDDCLDGQSVFQEPLVEGRGAFAIRDNSNILLAGTGGLVPELLDAAYRLGRQGIPADVYNLRFIEPIDEDYLLDILSSYKLVYLLEDGVSAGGIGEMIGSFIQREHIPVLYKHWGIKKEFPGQASRKRLIQKAGLDGGSLCNDVIDTKKKIGSFHILRKISS